MLNKLDKKRKLLSYNSYLGYIKYASSYNFRTYMNECDRTL